jgi:hypothetical protein
MQGGRRPGAGRKPIEIDFEQLEKLASLQCTDRELAAFFRCDPRTLENRRKDPAFKEALDRGKALGQISVRRAQMKLLEAGNATMGIWLGKQLLGQRDVTPVELTGSNGSEIKFSVEVIDAIIAAAKKGK